MQLNEYLTLMLDTPLSNPSLMNYLGGYQSYSKDSLKAEVLAIQLLGGLSSEADETRPVICKNCRNSLGLIRGQLMAEDCYACQPVGVVTEARKAVWRLEKILDRLGIKERGFLIDHLAAHELPTSSQLQLNKKIIDR